MERSKSAQWATQAVPIKFRRRISKHTPLLRVVPEAQIFVYLTDWLLRAILDMKNQRDKLHQYQKRITVVTDREREIAKECLKRGDKTRALLALRRKKYQESLLAKTDAQLAQLEILTNDVEFALVQKDVLFGLQQGTAVLKEIHKEMGGLENVEKLLGETEEAQAYTRVRIRFGYISSRQKG